MTRRPARAGAFLGMHRTRRDPVRLGLSRQEARVEAPGRRVAASLAGRLGLPIVFPERA